MENLLSTVEKEFENWKKEEPNLIQKGLGFINGPLSPIFNPILEKITPLLEGAMKGLNNYIAQAVQNYSEEWKDIRTLNEGEFVQWLNERDNYAENWIKGGIAALATEGGAGGFMGFAAVMGEIPVSFATLLTFANKIALTYNLDISNESIQSEILKAITAGSSASIDSKMEVISTFKVVNNILEKSSWTALEKLPVQSMGGFIFTIRALLKKIGINITKRKATQLIPGIGALAGAAINGSWASDSLTAVKQYSRYIIVNSYYNYKKQIEE